MTANNNCYRSLSLKDVPKYICSNANTLILLHARPDGDAVGSSFALRLILEAMGCRVLCCCEDELPDRLRFLVGDMQKSICYKNVPSNFSPEQVISVDSASPSQLGGMYDHFKGHIDLMIDHHSRGEMYADGWINGERAAAGEMVYELSRELLHSGRIAKIPDGVDRLIYAAISSDTGCFRYSNASPSTHRIAADLLESGFDSAEINHLLFESKSYKTLNVEKEGFSRMRLFRNGEIAIIPFPYDIKEKLGADNEHLETLIDVARSLEGVKVAAVIRQPSPENIFRVSMRSSCDIDVAKICASFGGGGHIRAAGCTVTARNIDLAVDMILNQINAE